MGCRYLKESERKNGPFPGEVNNYGQNETHTRGGRTIYVLSSPIPETSATQGHWPLSRLLKQHFYFYVALFTEIDP